MRERKESRVVQQTHNPGLVVNFLSVTVRVLRNALGLRLLLALLHREPDDLPIAPQELPLHEGQEGLADRWDVALSE